MWDQTSALGLRVRASLQVVGQRGELAPLVDPEP